MKIIRNNFLFKLEKMRNPLHAVLNIPYVSFQISLLLITELPHSWTQFTCTNFIFTLRRINNFALFSKKSN